MPLSERDLIARIARASRNQRTRGRTIASVVAGIGDDCAVLRVPENHELLVTTDFCLENVHFRRAWHPARSIGHRCLTRGLSDIAAMGGIPFAAFLSLSVPRKTPQRWVDEFIRGLLALARNYDTTLAGGDTAQSPDLIMADIIVAGSVPKGEAVLRSGAHAGDRIYVTGALGTTAAEVEDLFSGKMRRASGKLPQPRVNVGQVIRQKRIATAMIDISDGLSTDLHHICSASGVGAEVWKEAVPRGTMGDGRTPVDARFALHGGDAYELLFTAPEHIKVPQEIDGVPIAEIGRVTSSKTVQLLDRGRRTGFVPQGWQHFKR